MSYHQLATSLKGSLITTATRLLGPRLAAQLIARTIDYGELDLNEQTILCLTRPQFSKDIEQLRRHTTTNWICVKNEFLGHAQKAWLPKQCRVQTHFQKTQGGQHQDAWDRCELFAKYLLQEIEQRVSLKGILVGHIDYWQGECLRLAGEKCGISYNVLSREHCYLPIQQETSTEYYSTFNFKGDSVCVMGEQMRNVFTNSKSCRPEQVYVTGAPRFDAWRDGRSTSSTVKRFTLLSFRASGYQAQELFKNVLQTFLEFSRRPENRASSFVVKAKDPADTAAIRAMATSPPRNFSIDDSFDMPALLQSSTVVVGFNSLSMVEALMSDAVVVSPFWLEAAELDPRRLVFDPNIAFCGEAIRWPRSPAELLACLEQFRNAPPELTAGDRLARQTSINYVVHFNEQEKSSVAVERCILNAEAR